MELSSTSNVEPQRPLTHRNTYFIHQTSPKTPSHQKIRGSSLFIQQMKELVYAAFCTHMYQFSKTRRTKHNVVFYTTMLIRSPVVDLNGNGRAFLLQIQPLVLGRRFKSPTENLSNAPPPKPSQRSVSCSADRAPSGPKWASN